MNEQELNDILGQLEKAGMKPMLCDCPVQHFDAEVHAGNPTEIGEPERGEYMLLPRKLLGYRPVVVIHVVGDSMKEADVNDGDQVSMEVCDSFSDGDIVVAYIDGKYTIKTYFVDEKGNPWLVPGNKAYKPIRLTEDMNVCFFGRVVNIIRAPQRASYRELAACVKQAQAEGQSAEERMAEVITSVAEKVQSIRQWFAVYKGLVAVKAFAAGDYEEFARMVNRLVPGHSHPADATQLRCMEKDSFRKAPVLWEKKNAPVSGKRFDDYLRLARFTMEEMAK